MIHLKALAVLRSRNDDDTVRAERVVLRIEESERKSANYLFCVVKTFGAAGLLSIKYCVSTSPGAADIVSHWNTKEPVFGDEAFKAVAKASGLIDALWHRMADAYRPGWGIQIDTALVS